MSTKFSGFGFGTEVMEAIESFGFNEPTPIQEMAIPIILENKDLIGCAQTGTGKTAAYLLPLIENITRSKEKGVKALILVPTRELALQIDQMFQGFAYYSSVSSATIYGGGDGSGWDQQKQAILGGADVLIATPGRMLAHKAMAYVKLPNLKYLILDEADRMLDMGFVDDIVNIIEIIPKERQSLLFSATMPPKIRSLAKKILNEPEQINLALSTPAEEIVQAVYEVENARKPKLILELLKGKEMQSILIFCSTKKSVKELEIDLRRAGQNARAIHSDLDQRTREEVLLEFRNRRVQILVATDIMSRGIDIQNIDLVINYDTPQDPEDYVHRVGRTARAKATGVAITFVNRKDKRLMQRIEQLIGYPIYKIPLKDQGPGNREQGTGNRKEKGKSKKSERSERQGKNRD